MNQKMSTKESKRFQLQKIQQQIEKIFLQDSRFTYSQASQLEKISGEVFPQDYLSTFFLLKSGTEYEKVIEKLPKDFFNNEYELPLYILDYKDGCEYKKLKLKEIFDILPEQIKKYRSFVKEVEKEQSLFAEVLEEADRGGDFSTCRVKENDFRSFEKFIASKKIAIETDIKKDIRRRVFLNSQGGLYDLERDGEDKYEDWISTGDILSNIGPNPFVNSLFKLFGYMNSIYNNFLIQTITNSSNKSFGLIKKLFFQSLEDKTNDAQTNLLLTLQRVSIKGLVKTLKMDAKIYESTKDERVQEGVINKIKEYIDWVDNLNVPKGNLLTTNFDVLRGIGLQCKKVVKFHREQLEKENKQERAMQTLGAMVSYLENINRGVLEVGEKIDTSTTEIRNGFKVMGRGLEQVDTTLKQGFKGVDEGLDSNRIAIAEVESSVQDLSESFNTLLLEIIKD